MLRFLLLVLPTLVLMTSCTRTPPMQVVMDIPPIVRAPDLLKRLDLNVPRDLARTALREAAAADAADFDAAPAFLGRARTPDDAARAIDCLTAAIYYEARSESDEGERAVAQVVLNRVRDPAFPDSICGVVYQGSARSSGCQFSFTCDGSMNHPIEPSAWARARAVATGALAGLVYAPVGSATFYHANYVSPWWATSMRQVAAVGAHIFYRWRGAMENALAFRQTYSGSETLPARTSPILAAADEASVPPASAANGGIQVVGSVTIHRSTPEDAAPAAAAAPAVAPVAESGVAGVRVHRGALAPAIAQDVGKPRHITVPPAGDPA
ncbi:cell wall hydrolase [Sphingomonas sp. H39-1-10]|uniref:cell wall hydrolase n=1 Tax=Sphingomonas TaxID=13687 RepID=UPI0008816191|nr:MULTISPECIES: cell wall hydrolase [Sphingomonas]MDF0488558.1 cell wall hydrolase [Sphingomonas pollutisoli]SDA11871.1 Cell Wall Hydrolase [Sphingomonas sp. NFR15]